MISLEPTIAGEVWKKKGRPVPGISEDVRREDALGEYIDYLEYNNSSSEYGWVIVRITPEGGDVLPNLQPLNCRNAAAKCHGPAA